MASEVYGTDQDGNEVCCPLFHQEKPKPTPPFFPLSLLVVTSTPGGHTRRAPFFPGACDVFWDEIVCTIAPYTLACRDRKTKRGAGERGVVGSEHSLQ